ncbi:hypothetical protein L195_g061969, partial [Trifolium pratense]
TSAVEETLPQPSVQNNAKQVTIPNCFGDTYTGPTLSTWDYFQDSFVITGGRLDKHSIGSIKRKFEELIDISSNMNATLDKAKGRSMPLSFYLEEMPGGTTNFQIPLLVRA